VHVVPNGAERKVATSDLLFSTTDRKGVTDGANAAFCHYAQYSMDEMLHEPQSLVRHPDMPGGAFQIMWDLLLAGHPMGAYLKNLGHDGAAYWVFATITPLGDGFLSVHQAPCRADLCGTADALYQKVLPIELAARSAGASRIAAARLGAAALTEGIASLGFSSYADFIRLAVPAEIRARRELTSWTGPDARDPGTGVAQDLIDAAKAVDLALDSQMSGLDELEVLSGRLATTSNQTESSLERLRGAVAAAVAASGEVSATEPVLGRVVGPLSAISQWLREALEDLRHRLEDVRGRIAELRLRIALARLHDETLAEFAREMAAGDAPERAPIYVQQLCHALEETATTAAREVIVTNEGLRTLAQDLVEVEREMRTFQRQLATWRLLIPRYRLSARLDPYTEPIDTQLKSGLRQVAAVRQLADQCLANSRPFDSGPLSIAVNRVVKAREAVDAMLAQHHDLTAPRP
jgi:aerotaxis receptor